MKKRNNSFVIGTAGCVIMALVYAAIAVIGLVSGSFPLGYMVEAFTTNKIGIVILFLAAAAELVSIVITQIVCRMTDKISLISKGTMFTSMAFIALIFVFQQSLIPIVLWALGGAASVATLSACSEMVRPPKAGK